ncbi:MjaI family restriction endonuclease [uncultured Alistipes sp.]|uniref:MjaI family restriction endonuclease n=1 Tax=uncultured Alistipes sp. TaxID=538949 RepID=UPI00258C4DBF|nr:MjaI family restriction endonuclease [uncultured Alistipes sp.]
MKKLKISNTEVQQALSGKEYIYPKYSTQIINLANQNSQGTRPKVVGQMSDLIQEFAGQTIAEWQDWYQQKQPNAIENATNRIYPMVQALQESIKHIDRDTVKKWVEELVLVKTFCGLKFQSAILSAIAEKEKKTWRLATPEEEARGIDGFIANAAVSIKPSTYKIENRLNEIIDVPIIFYNKKKDGIVIEYNF